MTEEWEAWANEGSNGNVVCKKCGREQSPAFYTCIDCCSHDELELVSDWQGGDDYGHWGIDYECKKCGKNFFTHDEILSHYKLVRKQAVATTDDIVSTLKDRMTSMDDESRLALFAALTHGYCMRCGTEDADGQCQCWNDE